MAARGLAEIEWAVERARSGAPALRLSDRRADGHVDPLEDAVATARRHAAAARRDGAGVAILVGTGLGHLARALQAELEIPLVGWEPFPALVAAACAAAGVAPVTGVARDPESFERALADAMPTPMRPHVVVHPGYETVARFETRYVATALRRALGPVGPRPLDPACLEGEALARVARLPRHPVIDDVAGRLAGQRIVVVSPGPSLDAFLPVLARRSGGVVIASIQSLAKLHRAGVSPDLVVAVDPEDLVARFAPRVPIEAPWILADTGSAASLLDRAPERTLLFHLRSPGLVQCAWERLGLAPIDQPMVTVSETMVELALRLGAAEVAILGADFCADDRRYPVRFVARDVADRPVPTNDHYFHAARYLAWRCRVESARGRVFHRPERGLPVSACRPLRPETLETWLAEAAPAKLPPLPTPDVARRSAALTALLQELAGTAPVDGARS